MKKLCLLIVKIIGILICGGLLSYFLDFENNDIVSYSFALTTNIALFSLSLAITAIFFAIVDKYQSLFDKTDKTFQLFTALLREMGENTFALLIITFLTFIFSILQSLIDQKINNCIIICSMLLTFIIIFDITRSTVILLKEMPLISKKEERNQKGN